MNYYQKYLKYKNKYFEIKKQFGGTNLIELSTKRIKEALVYTMKLYPKNARQYFTELAVGNGANVQYWVAEQLKGKNEVLNEVIQLIDNVGIDQATSIIHKLIPNYSEYLLTSRSSSVQSSVVSSGRAMSFDSSSRVDSSGRAMAVDSSSKKYSLEDLARTNNEFRNWTKKLHDKKKIADNLAEFNLNFEPLLDQYELQKVYDFIYKGGNKPSWILLSELPIVTDIATVPAKRVDKPIYPRIGSFGYLKTPVIRQLYNSSNKTLILKEPNVPSMKTQAYYADHLWIVFHPFHKDCKEVHKSRKHTFIDIDIPIEVVKDENKWD
jgi:hypothetical protein